MFGLGMHELIIVGVVAVLLFGRKLPEVARSLGTSYREFRKGLGEITSAMDVRESYYSAPSPPSKSSSYDDYDDYEEATAPKFEPPPSEPQPESEGGST